MKKTFLNYDYPLLTTMVQADTPQKIKFLMDKSLSLGAEAFGMQFERLKSEFKDTATLKDLFAYAKDVPVYFTNYRFGENEGKSDEVLAEELLNLAKAGGTLCDVMGDYFDAQPGELTMDKAAIDKQVELINKIHAEGCEVLMSSHIHKFTPAERVLEIALEHQRRGADISKIVTGAETRDEQIENLKILNLLKQNLKIPFLFLINSESGESHIFRRIAGEFGNCMYLVVCQHDEFSTVLQPLLANVKAIRDNLKK